MGTVSRLGHLDQAREDLQLRFPGWQIWYVYRAPEHGGPVWCARPWPLINTDSPDHLAQEINMHTPGEVPESDSEPARSSGLRPV